MKRCYLIALPLAFTLAGCQAAGNLIYEPEISDPLDGYRGSLAQAGINTEMDWGPKQNQLLSQYKALMESHANLEKQLEDKLAQNQNLQAQLGGETTALAKEKALRAQAEAETEQLRQRRRDLEARILSLSIAKAKLEQSRLLSKIDALQLSMEPMQSSPVEAATPPRQR